MQNTSLEKKLEQIEKSELHLIDLVPIIGFLTYSERSRATPETYSKDYAELRIRNINRIGLINTVYIAALYLI
jgi:hypothetical protein